MQRLAVRDDDGMTENSLRIGFTLRGLDGHVDVSLRDNSDPVSLGYRVLFADAPADWGLGYPVCEATVTYPGQGYAAVFGWTQLVRSTDSAAGTFEMDPIAIYAEIPTPFAWFGVRPVLFDAPSREGRPDMDWEARSFLCVSSDAVISRRVVAVTGFSWGFTIKSGEISISEPWELGADTWSSHLALLRREYPQWAFEPGYASS
jgi:hypothetical protein